MTNIEADGVVEAMIKQLFDVINVERRPAFQITKPTETMEEIRQDLRRDLLDMDVKINNISSTFK